MTPSEEVKSILKDSIEILTLLKQVVEAPVSGLGLVREDLEPTKRRKKDE
jgi:hypothetical protein